MKLVEFHWPSGQKLTDDYVQESGRAMDLFDYHPWDGKSWEQRADWLDQRENHRISRSRLAEVLLDYNHKVGNSEKAIEHIRALRNPETLVVIGGQQAELFTGSLYVIHKAITILQLAKQAEEKLGRPVIPVFWIAGEDHDIDEVDHIHVLSAQQKVEKIKLATPHGWRSSVSRMKIGAAEWNDALQWLQGSLPDTELKAGLLSTLRSISCRSETMTDFFAGILSALFADYGLVMMDSDDPAVRKLEGPVFARMVTEYRSLNESFLESTRKVEELGYRPQVEVYENGANLFLFEQQERKLLFGSPKGFQDKKAQLHYSESEILRMAEEAPEKLSNNVLTRPLMQEFLFPVLFTVLGPGEIAYWSQTVAAFHKLDMKSPIIMPRMGYTLLEGPIQKQMNKYGFSFEDVIYRFDEKKQAWLDQQDDLRLEERFAEIKQKFEEIYRPLLKELGAVQPGLDRLGSANILKIQEQIDFLKNRSIGAYQQKFEAAVRQMDRVRLSILPLGKPQERVYNVFAYLNKYGDEWLHELISKPLEVNGNHRIVYL
ncbi:bacillithiol biosynthesis cysteine-adding enzyme BshC [Ferviditalea candida]|uniref:Putative cysteine ligase BshC n=1 Tax=Ferviditalea candida TaxID=3108399 RepID=A0ABU5ZDU1_9BACL|nr:bacillithiol biosynthesis cysteine-adding enzyme BshC [Paenibacillaceae bacterium T2]